MYTYVQNALSENKSYSQVLTQTSSTGQAKILILCSYNYIIYLFSYVHVYASFKHR